MIFIGGISSAVKQLEYLKTVICSVCGGYGRYQVFMTYTYFSFFFIPLFKWNRKFYVKMTCCGSVYELNRETGMKILRDRPQISERAICLSCREEREIPPGREAAWTAAAGSQRIFPTAPSAEENYKIFFIYRCKISEKEVKHMLEAGIKGREEVMVTEANSAAAVGSGLLPVFATPAMVALMEQTSWKSVAPYLNEGEGTVGTSLNISHSAATPLGMKVWCESELTEVDRRRLVFHVTCYDEAGVIGEGTHERFIIGNEKFLAKAEQKKNASKGE